MKLLNFRFDNHYRLGVLTNRGVLDVVKACDVYASDAPRTMQAVIASGSTGVQQIHELAEAALSKLDADLFYEERQITFGPSVLAPQKIICVGTNYVAHANESNLPTPSSPLLFSKFNNTLAGHNTTIAIPPSAKHIDYEVELVIVIGKEANNIREQDALSYVFGYSVGNDLSARDLQFKTSQWLLGKSCDGFAPLGPYLVTRDEVDDPNQLNLSCSVNGEVRQSSNTSQMIFNCEALISYISEHMTLHPGDVIFTGTPEGVILGMPEDQRQWLKTGDEISCSVEGIGTQRILLR